MKVKWYSILLVGFVLVLAILPLSCGSDHIDNAQDYLKKASRATSDLRSQVKSQKDDHELLLTIDYLERLIDDALSELHDMRPNY